MTTYTVTFIFSDAVITTAVEGDHAIIPRAKAKLEKFFGARLPDPIELNVYEHPKEV